MRSTKAAPKDGGFVTESSTASSSSRRRLLFLRLASSLVDTQFVPLQQHRERRCEIVKRRIVTQQQPGIVWATNAKRGCFRRESGEDGGEVGAADGDFEPQRDRLAFVSLLHAHHALETVVNMLLGLREISANDIQMGGCD